MDYELARANMIEQQVRTWEVLDQRVLDVMGRIPREAYVAEAHRGIAYSDTAVPIGHGQRMLKPIVDGRLLQALTIEPEDHVLEIGTGSGYLTTCMAALGARVTSLEIDSLLAQGARSRLREQAVESVEIIEQDAAKPWDAASRYDAIAFGGAVGRVPEFYLERLAVGGRLFAIVGDPARPTMEARLVFRVDEREWTTESLFEQHVDALDHFRTPPPAFVF